MVLALLLTPCERLEVLPHGTEVHEVLARPVFRHRLTPHVVLHWTSNGHGMNDVSGGLGNAAVFYTATL